MVHTSTSNSSRKVPRSPISRSSDTEVTSLSAAVIAWNEDWELANQKRRVRKNAVPASFGDAIQTTDSDAGGGAVAISGASAFMPCVTLPGVPLERYPEYLEFLYRATMAATCLEHPGLYSSISTPLAYYLTTVIVAVRVGTWASVRRLPVESYPVAEKALYYDEKRDRLWVQSARAVPASAAWRRALDAAPLVRSGTMETMLLWCKVAPLVLCTACTGLFALSGTYSTPFVDDAIARYMRGTAGPEASKVLRLDRAVVWDSARAASVEGMPDRLVHAWTDDPLLAVTAERRIMTSESSLRASRMRGERVLAKLNTGDTVLNLVSSDPGGVEHQKALWEAVARAKEGLVGQDDDAESVATALMDDSRDGKLGLATLPDIEEETASGTLTPLVPEMPQEVTLAERAAVRDIIRNAHSSGEQAASVSGNMVGNMPVEW